MLLQFFVLLGLEQVDRDTLRLVKDHLEFCVHQLDLIIQFGEVGHLSKLHGLNESLLELFAENMSSFNLKIAVTQSDHICNCIILHIGLCLKESLDLPLLVIARVELFVSCARGDYRYLALKNLVDLGKETLGRKFNPALLSVGDDVDTTEVLSLDEQLFSRLVQLLDLLLDNWRDRNERVLLQILVGSEDTGAEDGVVPIKDDACLAQLGLVLRLEPYFVL